MVEALARRPRPCLSRGFSGSEVLYADHCAAYRVHRATSAEIVSKFDLGLMSDRPLVLYALASSFSAFCPPQSTFTMLPALDPKTESATYQGFGPICGITQRVHSREVSQRPATFRPQAFSASRRFPPRSSFSGLFRPETTSRVHLFRDFSLRRAPSSFRKAASSSPLARSSSPPEGDGRLHARRPRGLNPCEDPSPSVECYPLRRPLPSSGSSSSRF